jgi:GNAT superfamily N-acetyltransferase
MKIRETTCSERASSIGSTRPAWLESACDLLEKLPDHPCSRLLVAEEDRQPRAVLGLQLHWGVDGRLLRTVICILAVDPTHGNRGIGSRLVRFAEGIARIHGCTRVDVAPGLERWCEGGCWTGLGYDDPGAGLHKVLESPIHGTCA